MELKKLTTEQNSAFQGWGYIHVDANLGAQGAEWPLGTPAFPVATLANARIIAAIRQVYNLVLHGPAIPGAYVIDAAMEGYHFYGLKWGMAVDFNAQDVDSSSFEDLMITGTQGGTAWVNLVRCRVYNVVSLRGYVRDCELHETIDLATGGAADYIDFYNCRSALNNPVTIEVNSPDTVNFFNFVGSMILADMTGGIVNIWAGDGAQITVNNTCTGGTINIYGNARVTDNSAGTVVNHRYLDFAIEENNDILSGMLVQVPFFVTMDTIVNNVITLFNFDALGATIRDVFINFYLPLHATATFTITWEKTRAGDLVTYVAETINPFTDAAYATIATPAANAVYRYHLGEIAQGLQGRLRIAQDNNAPAVSVDAFAVALLEL